MKEFKKGFFEYIAAADAEKVHSQTIGWMFSDNCDAISPSDKSELLRLLTNSNYKMRIKKVYVELYDIDILIICNDCFVVIENKIKSGQHSDQLNKYMYLTSENTDKISGFERLKNEREELRKKLIGLKENYIFLTLLNENSYMRSAFENDENKWIDVSYKKLADLMTDKVELTINDHGIILNNYLKTIRNLTNALISIETDKEVIGWMFNNGSLTHKKRLELEFSDSLSYPNETCQFISESGLVRFAQKYYYKVVCDIINQSSNELNLEVNAVYASSENNGGGLIQIDFPKFNFKANGRSYKVGYQIQGVTEKINLADGDYQNSKKNEVELFLSLIGIKDNFDNLKQKINFQRRNPGVSKPYHSISNTLDINMLNYNPSELAKYIIDKINYCQSHLEEFFSSISKNEIIIPI